MGAPGGPFQPLPQSQRAELSTSQGPQINPASFLGAAGLSLVAPEHLGAPRPVGGAGGPGSPLGARRQRPGAAEPPVLGVLQEQLHHPPPGTP